jgi:RNA polymerase-binding transcription factor DksA
MHLIDRMTTESAQLRNIRERLQARRLALLSRYKGALERADEELATPAHELVDVASEQWDAQILSEMSDVDARALEEVISALHRLEAGTYGTCAVCGELIDPARLRALPEAAECVECVRFAEETPPRWVMSVGKGR